jgi:hypothetical protein
MKERYEDLEEWIGAVQEEKLKKCFLTVEVKNEEQAIPTEKGMVRGTKLIGNIMLSAGKVKEDKSELFLLYSEPVIKAIGVSDEYKDFDAELMKKTEEITKKLQKEIGAVRLNKGVVFP